MAIVGIDENKRKQIQDDKRKKEILSELESIDIKTIRPLRNGELNKVQELESLADLLRTELRLLNA